MAALTGWPLVVPSECVSQQDAISSTRLFPNSIPIGTLDSIHSTEIRRGPVGALRLIVHSRTGSVRERTDNEPRDRLSSHTDHNARLRDYTVEDLHGYRLSFGHHIYTQGPSIEIDRVDVTVRLEKRLARVLADVAEFKRMNLGSCLEETLLHTFDGVGPHTKSDLRRIEKLKKKHGIDYDSHASYRFVERSAS